MERKMFCFQCEQTAGCSACTGGAGVCGKKADTAELQDKLTGALIGLARAVEGDELPRRALIPVGVHIAVGHLQLLVHIGPIHALIPQLLPHCAYRADTS